MHYFLIAYDLHQPGRNYSQLIQNIRSVPSAFPPQEILESTWIVNSTLSSPEIRDRLTRAIDGNDEVFVIEINPRDWAGYLKNPKVAWMNSHLG